MKTINIVSAFMIVVAVLHSNAQVRGGIGELRSPREEREDFRNRRPPSGFGEQKIIYLNRLVRNETLALRQLAGIGQGYQGALIESVDVRYRGGRGMLHLLADNSVVASEQIYNGYASLRSYQALVLDQNTRTLRLQVQGATQIESITIYLSKAGGHPGHPGYPGQPGHPGYPGHPGQPGGQVLEQIVNQQFFGLNRLDLFRGMNLMPYQGHRIISVQVEAEALNYGGSLRLIANNYVQTGVQVSTNWPQMYFMQLSGPAVIGRDLRQLAIETNGQLRIHRILVQIAR